APPVLGVIRANLQTAESEAPTSRAAGSFSWGRAATSRRRSAPRSSCGRLRPAPPSPPPPRERSAGERLARRRSRPPAPPPPPERSAGERLARRRSRPPSPPPPPERSAGERLARQRSRPPSPPPPRERSAGERLTRQRSRPPEGCRRGSAPQENASLASAVGLRRDAKFGLYAS